MYERMNAEGGRALEFDYYDETGRRRWHLSPAGTTLKQAQATPARSTGYSGGKVHDSAR